MSGSNKNSYIPSIPTHIETFEIHPTFDLPPDSQCTSIQSIPVIPIHSINTPEYSLKYYPYQDHMINTNHLFSHQLNLETLI